jgi:hypothetical protein
LRFFAIPHSADNGIDIGSSHFISNKRWEGGLVEKYDEVKMELGVEELKGTEEDDGVGKRAACRSIHCGRISEVSDSDQSDSKLSETGKENGRKGRTNTDNFFSGL